MAARKPRIEIKIVSDEGTIGYRHAKGDRRPDGQPAEGPSTEEFDLVRQLIHQLVMYGVNS